MLEKVNDSINHRKLGLSVIGLTGGTVEKVMDVEQIQKCIDPFISELDGVIKTFVIQAVSNVVKDNDDHEHLYRVLAPILLSCGLPLPAFETMWMRLSELYFQDLHRVQVSEEVVPFESPVQMSASKLVQQQQPVKKVSLDWLASRRTVSSQVDRVRLEKIEARHRQRKEKKLQGSGSQDVSSEAPITEKKKTLIISPEQVDKAQLEDMLQNGIAGSVRQDIHVNDFDISIGSKRILTNASLSLSFGHIYGLVGRNGIGKSTLLRYISNRDLPQIPANLSILHVEQEAIGDETPVLEAVLSADRKRMLLKKEEERLLKSAEAPEKLKRVSELLLEMDADTATARAAVILSGLGFSAEDQKRPTREFSGGWRMRVALASALFCQPDLLLLDEPTNMLDIPAVAWLEDHLCNAWSGTVIVVSHDRAFLNGVATDILHLHDERIDPYKGNYEQFVVTKDERLKNAQREYDNQLAYRQHLQSFIDRWRCNANRASQAQSRLKVLEKLPDLPPPVVTEPAVVFRFPPVEPLPSPVMSLAGVSFAYPNSAKLLSDIELSVESKSRMAIVGPNGAGKSTLLKLLTGQLEPTQGIARVNPRLRVAYFSQHHVDQMDFTFTPVELFMRNFPGNTEEEQRRLLGAFGISGPLALQRISTLSGGQKSRVVFAMLSAQKPHALVLDEPTNHLDMDSIDALIKACKEYEGAIIAVSHDQRFIGCLCDDSIYVCNRGSFHRFRDGGIEEYIKQLRSQ